MNEVKIIVVPGTIKNVAFEGSLSVREITKLADLTPGSNDSVKIDGKDANYDTEVSGNATVIIARDAKGNR